MNLRSLLKLSLTVVFIGGLAALLFATRASLEEAADEIANVGARALAASFLVLLIGRVGFALAAWTGAANELAAIEPRAAATVWLRTAVAKYLPGGLWQPLNALQHLTSRGGTAAAAGSVVIVDICASAVAALAVGLVAVPALVYRDSGTAAWLLLGLPLVALLHPRVFGFVLRLLQKFTVGKAPLPRLTGRLVVRTVALHVLGWVLAGISLAIVLLALGVSPSLALVIPATALSWLVGFLFVIAPAGLGVREVALVALLAGTASQDQILAAALLSRLMFMAVDLLSAVVSFIVDPRAYALH